MTLAILIISLSIAYYNYKKSKNNYLNEKLLLFMLLIASVVWLFVSIIDFYNYGNMVFKPSLEIFIKDTMNGFIVLAISMFLWFLSIITSGKNINKINIDKNKIKQVFSNKNENNSFQDNRINQNVENTNEQVAHQAPNISVDYSMNQNDNNSRKGYFPYGNNPFKK